MHRPVPGGHEAQPGAANPTDATEGTDMFKTASLLIATCKDRKGVTAAEYAVLAVGVVIVVATAAGTLGTRLTGIFNQLLPS